MPLKWNSSLACLISFGVKAGGWGKKGKFPNSEIQKSQVEMLPLFSVYICIHTYTYIYICTLHLSIRLLKNTDCFTTIAPLVFIIIHSNFSIHAVVVEIGTPALL